MRKPRVGDKIKVKKTTLPQYDGIVCTIKKVNWIYVTILPKYGRQEIEITDDDIESYENKEAFSGDEKKEIVKKLVLDESLLDVKNVYRELAILNKLIDKYPDLDFWRGFAPGYQARSIAWWLGGGSEELRTEYMKLSLDFSVKESKTGEVKLGEDIVKTKNQSLQSWLN
jgi:hypothetical protein